MNTSSESVVSRAAETSNFSPWLPPTPDEWAAAELSVDSRKHDGAIWWDGTSCALIQDEEELCPVAWGIHTERDRYVEAVARHLAWHARGDIARPAPVVTPSAEGSE